MNLLGDHIDMKLVGKVTLSVAIMLCMSWVFKFYSTRAKHRRQLKSRDKSTSNKTAVNTTESNETNGTFRIVQLPVGVMQENLEPKETNAVSEKEDSKAEDFVVNSGENSSSKVQDNMKDISQFVKMEKAELTPDFGDEVKRGLTGHRSPCMVRKHNGAVKIGRELRQDLGHPGNFFSFKSKAEIKVENADLVMEGDQSTGVRSKIYDYYVETSSQSVSDLSPIRSLSIPFGLYESNTLFSTQPKSPPTKVIETPQLPGHSSSTSEAGKTELKSEMKSETPTKLKTAKLSLIRKDSYLAAAEDIDFQISFPPTTTTINEVPASCESQNLETDFKWNATEEPQVERVARANFLHSPAVNIGNLTGKLDLGNCLEILMLAKKHGHSTLQQAALRVMSDNYFQVLRDPALYGRLMADEREQIQRLRRRGRKCLIVADMESSEWSSGSSKPLETELKKASSALYYYDDFKDSWHFLCQIPQEVFSKGCAMCTMDNYLFVAVGFQQSMPSKKVFCYNPITTIWSEIAPMNEARPHCKLVALEDYVYAIGGECLSTVERYDPRTNRWSYIAPLPNETFAVAHQATASNGELFVLGGTLKYTLLRYNPKTDTWRQSLIVGSKERTVELVSVRNFLYRFDVNHHMGINVYRYHVVARLWYECCSKQMLHCPNFQCVALDDIIYCVSRHFTMRFLADEISPGFVAEDLNVFPQSKGILFPFILTLLDKHTFQTSV